MGWVAVIVLRSIGVTVPVEATPRSSITTLSAFTAAPDGAVRSPLFGSRPPQFVT
jgi:hypothetical protein